MSDLAPKPGNPLRVLVCGDRKWSDGRMIAVLLSGLAVEFQHNGLVVIEGQAKGADQAAAYWCKAWQGLCLVTHVPFPADWNKHGKAAGPIRNKRMLTEGKPDVVYAFHDDIANSKGTKNMVDIATKAGIRCYVVGRNTQRVPLPEIVPVDVGKIRTELLMIEKEANELSQTADLSSGT